MKKYIKIILLLNIGSMSLIDGHVIYDLYNSFVYMPFVDIKNNSFFAQISTSYKNAYAFDSEKHHQNPLAIFNADQSALTSLEGFSPESAQGQLLNLLNTFDDGVRGHLLFDGAMRMNVGCTLGGIYNFAERWYLRVLL